MPVHDSPSIRNTPARTPSPVTLQPLLVERIWGTLDLSPWHTGVRLDEPVGEIWLTAESCPVLSGPDTGQTLGALTARVPERFGDPLHQGFPLLIKLLFPREKLSVQVHPNDAQAQALGMPRGKTECWYVLSAEPGAEVAVGFGAPLTPAEVKTAVEDGTLESKLQFLPVKAGDMVFVEAGTVHAIGPGMVVLETQQYSDTTYRLWDYGRPRELHLEAGAAVTRPQTAAGLVPSQPMKGFTRLVACQYFAVDRFQLQSDGRAHLEAADKLQILIALAAGCTVRAGAGEPVALPRAQAVILPADGTRYEVRAAAAAEIVRVLQP